MIRLTVAGLVCIIAVAVLVNAGAASTIFGTVAVSATVTIVASPIPEDLDGDGCVGQEDLSFVARDLGQPVQSSGEAAAADVNGDGQVDILDVALIAVSFGTRTFGTGPCP